MTIYIIGVLLTFAVGALWTVAVINPRGQLDAELEQVTWGMVGSFVGSLIWPLALITTLVVWLIRTGRTTL